MISPFMFLNKAIKDCFLLNFFILVSLIGNLIRIEFLYRIRIEFLYQIRIEYLYRMLIFKCAYTVALC